MIEKKAYSDYITEEALDAIGVLEDHWKGAEKTADGLITTYYGVTKWTLGSMRQLKNKYKIDVPEELMMPNMDKMSDAEKEKAYQKKLESLTPEQARDISGYFAIYNTKQLDSVYGEDECKYFSNLPCDVRSGILTLIHNEGERGTRLNYGKSSKNSLLQAAKTGDREALVMAMICDENGNLIQPPGLSNKRGHCNRVLAAIRLMYDPENTSFTDKKSFSKVYDDWRKDNDIIKKISSAALSVRMGNLAKEDDNDEMNYYCCRFREGANSEKIGTPAKIKDPAAERLKENTESLTSAFVSGFTKGFKNLFTRNKGDNNVTGNENVNMQQSTDVVGGGANQQPLGQQQQSSEDLQRTV